MNWIELLDRLDSFVWGPPLLVLLVGTGRGGLSNNKVVFNGLFNFI